MEKLDKYWDQIHVKYNSSYDGWLNKYVHLFKKENIFLELGCGRAYCSKYLLENGYEERKLLWEFCIKKELDK